MNAHETLEQDTGEYKTTEPPEEPRGLDLETENSPTLSEKHEALSQTLKELDALIIFRKKQFESYVNRSYENLFSGVNTLLNPSEHKSRWTHNLMIGRSLGLEMNIHSRALLHLQLRKQRIEEKLKNLKT